MSCCPDTRVPILPPPADYKEAGSFIDLDGLRVYTAGSPGKKGVVVIADVFGLDSGHHRAIVDTLSKEGYYVVAPDLFHGDKIASFAELKTPRIGEFLKLWSPEKITPELDKVYKHLKDKGVENVGAVGYCYGTWVIYRESARVGVFSCGVNVHPALGIEGMHGGDPVTLASKTKCPMLMLPCSDDPESVQPGGAVEKALQALPHGKECEFIKMADQNHGFASQGDLSKETVVRDTNLVMSKAVAYLKKYLA